jgi:carboxylesterase
MGGLLTLNIASNNRADGVILLSPAFDIKDYRFDFVPILQYILSTYGKDNASSYKDFYYQKVPTRSFTQLKFLIDYTWMHTINLKVPMIMFQSKYDDTVTYEGSKKYYELYKGPKKFISIEDPNVRHILSSSFNPKKDYVYDEIYKWLEEQNAKK